VTKVIYLAIFIVFSSHQSAGTRSPRIHIYRSARALILIE